MLSKDSFRLVTWVNTNRKNELKLIGTHLILRIEGLQKTRTLVPNKIAVLARGVINTIAGRLFKRKGSQHNRKSIMRSVMCMEYCKKRSQENAHEPISFTTKEMANIVDGYDEPMVITAWLGDLDMKRILVDQGSSTDIMYFHTYERLGVPLSALNPFTNPLIGFAGTQTPVEGTFDTRLTLIGTGEPPRTSTIFATFVVVAAPSAYNAILGRPSLSAFRAVVSTAHLLMKFLTVRGIACLRGDQVEARRCYATSLARVVINHAPPVIGRIEPHPLEPAEETDTVQQNSDVATEIADLRDEVVHTSG